MPIFLDSGNLKEIEKYLKFPAERIPVIAYGVCPGNFLYGVKARLGDDLGMPAASESGCQRAFPSRASLGRE